MQLLDRPYKFDSLIAITVLAALFVLLAALWLAPTIALHDFGEWLYQGKIIALKLTSPQLVVGFELHKYPVPNSLVPFILAALHQLLSPIVAGKLFLSAYLLAWSLVAWALTQRHTPDSAERSVVWSVLMCIGCLSSFFWYGFMSYQIGLLLLAGFLVVYRESTPVVTIAAYGILIFFCHAAILIQLGLLVGLATVFFRFPLRHLLALLPAGCLTLAYLVGRYFGTSVVAASDASWRSGYEALVYKMGMVTMHGPFKNFLLPDDSALLEHQPWLYWAGVGLNVIVTAALAVFALKVMAGVLRNQEQRVSSVIRLFLCFLLLLLVIYVLAPQNFFGLIHPGGRVILPFFIVLLTLAGSLRFSMSRVLAFSIALGSLFTTSTYFLAVTGAHRAAVAVIDTEQPPPEAVGSVLAYNSWLYRNTRYSYYNYRVFAFGSRTNALQNEVYEGLSFQTGPIARYSVPPTN